MIEQNSRNHPRCVVTFCGVTARLIIMHLATVLRAEDQG